MPDTDVSDAPEGFLDNFEDGGNGVLDPLDGVRTLKHTIIAYMSERARLTHVVRLPSNTSVLKPYKMQNGTDMPFLSEIFSERAKRRGVK